MRSMCFGALCAPNYGDAPEMFGKVQLLRYNFWQSGAYFQEKNCGKFSEKYSLKVHLDVLSQI